MSGPIGCCSPCPDPTVVNVPGSPGATGPTGTNGADGTNSFTITTADFVVPAVSSQVTVSAADWSWAQIGQNIFIYGAGTFIVTSKASNNLSATLTYLPYDSNSNSGNTISSGSGVSPGGFQPSVTLLPAISDYHVGGSQALTNSSVQLLSSTVTLAAATYLLLARVRLDFVGATTVSSQDVTLKLRETTNGPADIANTTTDAKTGIVTASNATFQVIDLPPVVYGAAAGDTPQIFGVIDAVPYIGSVQVIEASILAIKLF